LLNSKEKSDYEAEMVADYDHIELSEDGFNPKHGIKRNKIRTRSFV
jgi:HAE1 family hydrophobic/amphiphilic exporter-1